MDKQLLNKFPTWYKDLTPQKHYLVLSNDCDSYYSCVVLKNVFGLEIGGFYSLDEGLYLIPEKVQGKEPVFVDLSVTRCKTFDNHFTFINNPESINPNIMTDIYYKKYNGSTLAVVCSLFERDISKYSIKPLTTLLAIDGWYIGYYNKGGRYKDINIYWYKMLEMDKYLLPLLEANDNQFFVDHLKNYKLNSQIKIIDHHLQCNAMKNLPTCKFELVQPVKNTFMSKSQVQSLYQDSPNSIFTLAETYKNQYSVSIRKAV